MYRSPYRHPAWKQVRLAILDRDDLLCQIRGSGCTTRATCVDHIITWRDGGSWFDPTNLRASCQTCNNNRVDRKKFWQQIYALSDKLDRQNIAPPRTQPIEQVSVPHRPRQPW